MSPNNIDVGYETTKPIDSVKFTREQDHFIPLKVQDERYQIHGLLSDDGQTSVVWLGKDNQTGLEVVLKISKVEDWFTSQDFLKEARILAQFSDPRILRVFDFTTFNDNAGRDRGVVVMERAKGDNLNDLMKSEKLPKNLIQMFGDVAEIIDLVHGKGIVHKDIKPTSVLYDEVAKMIKLLDFGIATKEGVREENPKYTPGFSSPFFMRDPVNTKYEDYWSFVASLFFFSYKR